MTLEQALATARQDAEVMRRCGGAYQPDAVVRLLEALERAAQPFTTWLSESDAMLRSGRKVEYFRTRFPAWERQGVAELRGRVRYYRAVIVPQREHRAA